MGKSELSSVWSSQTAAAINAMTVAILCETGIFFQFILFVLLLEYQYLHHTTPVPVFQGRPTLFPKVSSRTKEQQGTDFSIPCWRTSWFYLILQTFKDQLK
jgi:hypothetical protein